MLATDLHPGDVLLMRGTTLLSDLICRFDGGAYSHAALWTGDRVVEALAVGVRAQPLAKSVQGAVRVDVYRYVGNAGPLDPVMAAAGAFVEDGDRYAYEALFLLAALTTFRRVPLDAAAKILLRAVLDHAAGAITTLLAAGRQPMICSEVVFRCYAPTHPLRILGARSLRSPSRTSRAGSGDLAFDRGLARFRAAYAQGQTAKRRLSKGRGGRSVVADFVTPCDLESSPSLRLVAPLEAYYG